MTNDTIGVDISKDHLDAHRMSDGASRRFANDHTGHKALMNWLGQPDMRPDMRIVYEPTGPYHRTIERRLAVGGFALVKVNPRHARRFAEATGRLAKTDRLDAAMLACMGALLDLEARPVRSPVLNDLKDLHMAREALVVYGEFVTPQHGYLLTDPPRRLLATEDGGHTWSRVG